MIVLSEEYWIEYNLRQHYDLADEIVIVEGAVPQAIADGLADEGGYSVDRTRELIENFPDPENKIKYLRVGKVKHRNALRSKYLDQVTGDWILIIDADEFYRKKDFDYIRESIDKADSEGFEMIWYDFNSFADWEYGARTAPMERLFKRQDGLEYPDRDTGQSLFKKGQKIWSQPKYPLDIRCWHYNRVHESKDRLFRKMKYYEERDHNRKCDKPEQLSARDQKFLSKEGLENIGFDRIQMVDHPEQIIQKYNDDHKRTD